MRDGDTKVTKYFMYFKLTESGQEKLFNCVCRGRVRAHNRTSWKNSLGLQGLRSDDIETVTSRDEIAVQVLSFIQVSNTVISKYEPIQVELNEYQLKLEYVILFKGSGQYAIAVVVHDKEDHSNALVTLDFLSKQ